MIRSIFCGEALDLYLASSFFAASLIWVVSYLQNPVLGIFFESSLVALSFYVWVQSISYRSIFHLENKLPIFLMFQTISLVAIAFELNKLGLIYLGIIPSIFSFYVSRNEQVQTITSRKSVVLVLIAASSYLFFHNYHEINFLFNIEGLILATFIFWTMGLFYNPFKKRKSDSDQNRMFFHDMVNHTHGLNLFLTNRVSLKKGLDRDECQSLIGEIKTMQSLLKDYFGFVHRDLINPYEYVSFEYAKEGIINLVRSFLPAHMVNCTFSYKGLLEGSLYERDGCTIHYPTFSRILTNLVKNISESQSHEVNFEFDYQTDGIHLIIKNRIFNLDNDSMELSKDLQKIILAAPKSERDQRIRGIGLESVTSICKELGGQFSFGVVDGLWISDIFLPIEHMKKRAA